MACSKCRQKEIRLQANNNEQDLTALEYTGKIAGGVIVGKATGTKYAIITQGNKKVIHKVNPQDARELVSRGVFRPLPKPKPKNKPIVSPTPQKVTVIGVPEVAPLDFVTNPGNYSIKQLKELVDTNNLCKDDLKLMRENEIQNKSRKGLLSFIKNKLK